MPFKEPGAPADDAAAKKPSRKLNIRKRETPEESVLPEVVETLPEWYAGRKRRINIPLTPEARAKKEAEAKTKEAVYGKNLKEARELLGDRVFGPEEVEKTFGFRPENIPPIPYSREDLEKAKELGEMLILRMDKDKDGKPLTLKRIQQLLEPQLEAEGKGRVGYVTWSQENEAYVTEDTPKLEWKLVSMDVLPNSTNRDYIEQTALLRDRFKANNLATAEELAECTDQRLAEIRTLMATDWKAAAEVLSNLLINKNHRSIPVEDIYDLVVPLRSRNQRRLENVFNWTSRRGSDGRLVSVGHFDARGTRRDWWPPAHRGPIRGVCSSR